MLAGNKVITGFAGVCETDHSTHLTLSFSLSLFCVSGATADAFTLLERLETKLEEYPGTKFQTSRENTG